MITPFTKEEVGLERLSMLLSILLLVSLKPDHCASPNPLLGASAAVVGFFLVFGFFSCLDEMFFLMYNNE